MLSTNHWLFRSQSSNRATPRKLEQEQKTNSRRSNASTRANNLNSFVEKDLLNHVSCFYGAMYAICYLFRNLKRINQIPK